MDKEKNKICFIDTHCHLDMCKKPIDEIIENAKKNDVKIIVTQGVNPKSNRAVLELASKYDIVKAALGFYPIDALEYSDSEIEKEIDFIRKNADKIVAIGEVGLDFKETEDRTRQIALFEKIIDLSIELNKPIIIHSRKAEAECIEILEKKKAKKVIMHCFSGKFSLVKRIFANGWLLTIPTSVTRSEHFQKIIKENDIKHLLCETDSPYLHPFREPENEPANVIESYKKIAEIKGIEINSVTQALKSNYDAFF